MGFTVAQTITNNLWMKGVVEELQYYCSYRSSLLVILALVLSHPLDKPPSLALQQNDILIEPTTYTESIQRLKYYII